MIGELVFCVISDTRSIKRDWIHVDHLSEQIRVKVEWTPKGRIAQRGRPIVSQRTSVSQPRVRYNFERGGRSVYAPLTLRSIV